MMPYPLGHMVFVIMDVYNHSISSKSLCVTRKENDEIWLIEFRIVVFDLLILYNKIMTVVGYKTTILH